MNKKIYLVIFFSLSRLFCLCTPVVMHNGSSLVVAELTTFKQSDSVKNKLEMKDAFLRHIMNIADKGIGVAREKSLLKRWLNKAFLNGFPGLEFEFSGVNGLFLATERQFPQLFKIVHKLTKRLNLSCPWIFINFDKDFSNAYACSLLSSASMVVLGYDLVVKLSDDEIEGLLAHELAHIKHNHTPKTLLGLAVILFVLGDLFANSIELYGLLFGVPSSNEINVTVIGKSLAKAILKFVFFLLCYIVFFEFARFFEKEADKTALNIVDNKQGVVDLFSNLYDETNEKYETYKKEYQMTLDSLMTLEHQAPWLKKILFYFVQSHHVEQCNNFEAILDGDGDLHPSLKARINSAKDAIALVAPLSLQVLQKGGL